MRSESDTMIEGGSAMDYAGLTGYLDRFQKESGLEVVIKDFIGLFEMDARLFEAVRNFYIHKSPYCMTVKGNPKLWDYCLLEKKMIYRRLMREPVPFFGYCFAGVGEYVLPVRHEGTVIAALAIGCFRIEPELLERKLHHLAEKYELDENALSNGYESNARVRIEDMEPYREQLEIIVEYLCLVYAALSRKEKTGTAGIEPGMNRSYTLSHVMEYLRVHHAEEVTLEDLSAFCHCSKSYLSHQFRLYTQMTMKAYINQLRVNSAKELMRSGKSITEAAFSVGFKDSNYFSKVFRDLEHKTPTEYLRE